MDLVRVSLVETSTLMGGLLVTLQEDEKKEKKIRELCQMALPSAKFLSYLSG